MYLIGFVLILEIFTAVYFYLFGRVSMIKELENAKALVPEWYKIKKEIKERNDG